MSFRNRLFGGLAAAALLGGGAAAVAATSASAATVAPATVMSYHLPSPNDLVLTWQGHEYTYQANLHEQWVAPGTEVISGYIHDGYEPVPVNLPVHGVQFGKDVVFSVQYPSTGPDAGSQGDRTFSGTWQFGHPQVSGIVTETGTEGLGTSNGAATFTLDRI